MHRDGGVENVYGIRTLNSKVIGKVGIVIDDSLGLGRCRGR